jgi:hypothetical protein
MYDVALNQMGNIGHLPFTSKIYVWQPGYYYINSGIHHIEVCQFSVFKNGVIYGNPYSSSTGATNLIMNLIMYIAPEDMTNETSLSPTGFAACIETVNHSSFLPFIILNNPAGSAPNDICASTVVVFLG